MRCLTEEGFRGTLEGGQDGGDDALCNITRPQTGTDQNPEAVDRASEAIHKAGDACWKLYIALRMYQLAEIADFENDEYLPSINDDD